MGLSGRARRMLREAQRRREVDPSEGGGELNIVPFLDIVVNLMLFLLATTTVTMAVAEVEVSLPGMCSARCREIEPGLDLTVTIVEGGFLVAGRGGRLAPGCGELTSAPGLTVEGHDFEALHACAERVHAAYTEEDSVMITADPQIPYEDVIAAMDALRGDETGLLFPRVMLSAGLR